VDIGKTDDIVNIASVSANNDREIGKIMADAFQRQVIYGGTLDTNLLEMRVVEEDTLLNYLGRAAAHHTLVVRARTPGRTRGGARGRSQAQPRDRARRIPRRKHHGLKDSPTWPTMPHAPRRAAQRPPTAANPLAAVPATVAARTLDAPT